MPQNTEDNETPEMTRRTFMDVVTKSAITTAAICLLPMSQVVAMAEGHPSSSDHPSSGCHPYIDHPTHPQDPDDNPYVPYRPPSVVH